MPSNAAAWKAAYGHANTTTCMFWLLLLRLDDCFAAAQSASITGDASRPRALGKADITRASMPQVQPRLAAGRDEMKMLLTSQAAEGTA